MKLLKINYHDGTIQICRPKLTSTDKSHFIGDWKGLAETVAGKHYRSEHAYKNYEVI